MIGHALAYPFVLARRKPVTVLVAVLAVIVIAAGLQVASEALTRALPGGEYAYQIHYVASYVAQMVAQAFPAGLVLAAALIDLEARAARQRPDLYDGVLVALISLTFAALVTAPLYGGQWLFARLIREQVVRDMFSEPNWMMLYVPSALWLVVALISGLIFFRFSFAWPHALATRRIVFFHAWRLSRGRFWRIASVLIPATVVAMGASFGGNFVWMLLSGDGVYVGPAAFAAGVARDSIAMFGAFYFNLANVYLYAHLLPPKPEKVAGHFG